MHYLLFCIMCIWCIFGQSRFIFLFLQKKQKCSCWVTIFLILRVLHRILFKASYKGYFFKEGSLLKSPLHETLHILAHDTAWKKRDKICKISRNGLFQHLTFKKVDFSLYLCTSLFLCASFNFSILPYSCVTFENNIYT